MRRFLLLLLFVPLVPSGAGVEAVGLEWTEFVLESGGDTSSILDMQSNGDQVGILWREATTEVKFSLMDQDGSFTESTVVSGANTLGSASLGFVRPGVWLAGWRDSTATDFITSVSSDNGATWGTPVTATTNANFLAVSTAWVIASTQDFAAISTSGNVVVYSTDGGASWSSFTCAAGMSGPLIDGVGLEFAIYGYTTGSPFLNTVVKRETLDGCATFESQPAGSGTWLPSGCPSNASSRTALFWAGGVLSRSNLGVDAGLCWWDGFSAGDGFLFFDANPANTFGVCRCAFDAVIYRDATTGDPTLWVNVNGFGVDDAEAVTGSLAAISSSATLHSMGGLRVFYGVTSGGDSSIYISDALPAADPGRVVASDLSAGFGAFTRGLGFQTTESQFFVGLILLGLTLVFISGLTKETFDDKTRLYLLIGASVVLVIVNTLLVDWRLWQLLVILINGGALAFISIKGMSFVEMLRAEAAEEVDFDLQDSFEAVPVEAVPVEAVPADSTPKDEGVQA